MVQSIVQTEKGPELPSDGVPIDELAQRTGMTVRNIRAHQARGLLPPPEVRGRTGYYGPEHAARIRLILDLQAQGLNLSAVKRFLDATPLGAAGEAASLRRALLEPWEEEAAVVVTVEELVARFGATDAEAQRGRQVRLGGLVDLGGGRYEVPSPSLLAIAEELMAAGIPLDALIKVEERLVRATDAIAKAFVELFEQEVWKPFDARGRPESEWPRVREMLERVRPMAVRSAVATLQRSMTKAVERTVARDLG